MTILMTAGFLALLGATLEAQTGYFPLEVGNRWIYSDGADTHELAITDTVRIAPHSHRGMWTSELPRAASEDRLYFLLEGEEILASIGLRPSPIDEESGEEKWPLHWSPFDVMLVREAGTLDGVYADWDPTASPGISSGVTPSVREYGSQDLIVAGGARDGTDGRWLLFEKAAYCEVSPSYSCGLVFEEGIGITRIAARWSAVLDLVDFTRGSDGTHVRPVSWGRLKKEMWKR